MSIETFAVKERAGKPAMAGDPVSEAWRFTSTNVFTYSAVRLLEGGEIVREYGPRRQGVPSPNGSEPPSPPSVRNLHRVRTRLRQFIEKGVVM